MGNKVTEKYRESGSKEIARQIAELIKRAGRGEIRAFEEIIGKFSPRVNAIAYQMTGNSDDARDIAQDVFVRLYQSIKKFDPEFSFTTWLYRITVNLSIDHFRRNLRHRHRSIDASDSMITVKDRRPGPDVEAENSDLHGAIAKLIVELSENQRTVFVLRDLQGFTTEEISSILKCRASTVRVHLSRARQKMKSALLKYYPELLEVSTNEML